VDKEWGGRRDSLGFGETSPGATDGFRVGSVADLLDSMGSERLGMVQRPTVGAQGGQIPFALQQSIENVFGKGEWGQVSLPRFET
jgi:hypothetical protein